MSLLKWSAAALLALPVLILLVGQAGLLAGSAPSGLGVHDGRLQAPSRTPNSVSSQAGLWPDHPQREGAAIAPLAVQGDAAATLARLKAILASTPGARIVEERPDYLYAQFSSRWLNFVDDVEFWYDPAAGVIQLRSASRLGTSDLGANRRRIEALRQRLAGAS